MITAVKKPETMGIYSQDTARPQKKIMLYDDQKRKQFFPLIPDKDVGMGPRFENLVIESVKMC